jgi:ComF family protein
LQNCDDPGKVDRLSIFRKQDFNIRLNFRRALPPQPCLLCGILSRDGLCCAACDHALPYLTANRCPVCALPTPQGEVCGSCLRDSPYFDRTVAVLHYAFPADRLIQAFKFQAQLQLAHWLAGKLASRTAELPDCIVPMPLHPARLRERGFNQSHELARHLAKHWQRPLLPHACKRIRDTVPQSSLPWKERDRNLHKAFVCETDFTGKHVALVDDVMTTGASLNELAQAVRRAGAQRISTYVVARTLPHS